MSIPNVDGVPADIIKQIVITYDTTILPFLVLCLFLCIAFSSEDKVKKGFLKGAKILFYASILLNVIGLLVKTVFWIIGEAGGNTTLP